MTQDKCDILCIGTALVDSIIRGFNPVPVSASGYRAESGSLNVGGEAVNEAVTAAKLGLRTRIMCHAGRDTAGDMICSMLEKNGVEMDGVIRTDHMTPVTTMFVNQDGTRKSITNEAHHYNFHPEQYVSLVRSARAVSFGSLFRAPFQDAAVIRAVIFQAKDAGALIIADTKLPNFEKLGLEDIRDVLPMIDYIFPNEDEAAYFSGKSDPDAAADVFLQYGIRNVIIKLGGRGCLYKNPEERLFLPAYDIDAVDATGAGDNFIAGFACEKLSGRSDEEALRFANACGAICTTAVGACTALRCRGQVLEFLEQRGAGNGPDSR